MMKSMKRRFGRIPAHYIVGKDGDFIKIKENEGLNVGATKNPETNQVAIQIETIGDFNKKRPTKQQYEMLGQLTYWLEKKYGSLEKTLHRNESATACPGKYFDINMIRTGLVTFKISRYYSPVEGQKKYYRNNYLEDKKVNCGIESNCLITAQGFKLSNQYAGKVVACPKEIPLGTKIYLENYGIVICRDRGGAIDIQNNIIRLDLWMGIGDYGLNNIYKNKYAGLKNGYILNSNK